MQTPYNDFTAYMQISNTWYMGKC